MTPDKAKARARDIVDEACLGEALAANGVTAALTEAIAAALLEAAGQEKGVTEAAPMDSIVDHCDAEARKVRGMVPAGGGPVAAHYREYARAVIGAYRGLGI
jgi:hypothetical protein